MQEFFDASGVQPAQGGGNIHPCGMFPASVSNTYLKPTQDQSGLMYVVEFTTPAGKIENRYNIYNPSAQAMEIAQKELSALCHATGRMRLSWPKLPDGMPNMQMGGAEMRGANLKIEVAPQRKKNNEGKWEETGYNEVKKVYDAAGNEPGKPAQSQQPQVQQNQQPASQGGWGNPQQQQQPPQSPPPPPPPALEQPGWGQPQPNQNPAPNPGNAGWSQQPNNPQNPANGKPAWAQ